MCWRSYWVSIVFVMAKGESFPVRKHFEIISQQNTYTLHHHNSVVVLKM